MTTRLDNSRVIRPATGSDITAKSWLTEAPMRMLMNNLHPDVAEAPHELVVYGGIGRAARDWESYDRIVETLKRLEGDETLLIQSGKPVGVFRTHENAPRVLLALLRGLEQLLGLPQRPRRGLGERLSGVEIPVHSDPQCNMFTASMFRIAQQVATRVPRVGGAEPMALRCRLLVNSAGLHAPRLARSLEGMPAGHVPTAYYAKGNYFTLTGRSPFTRLIYPVPVPGGLGTHLTIDLGGQARFGPDVEWVERIDYAVDPRRGESFYAAIRRYWPELRDGALAPDYTGIRPKLAPAGGPATDFLIEGEAAHGLPGLVNLYGIESPGLTASLAIAEEVLALAGARRPNPCGS